MVNNFFYFNEENAKTESQKLNPQSMPSVDNSSNPGSSNKKRRHLTFNRIQGLKGENEKS
jgi:hypothetical protein